MICPNVEPKNLRVVSIIDGSERSLPYELVRPMSMPDLMSMRFSLNHLYLNSHFNRLAKNNRFIGPDAEKTWRRITMKNKANEAQQEEHDVQETNTDIEAEATPDPDMFRRVTRSGTAFLASVSTSHPILKNVAFNKDYDMAVILSSSQHSLAALKAGIHSQDRKPLTDTEKGILSIDHNKLTPTLSFHP